MDKRILVAYASGTGSTAQVAEAVGEVLAQDGTLVDVLPAREVLQLAPYGAVVLGSSIRAGRWLPDAVDFLDRFGQQLAGLPVAYFTTCLTMAEDTAENRRIAMSYMEPILLHAAAIEPVALGLFAGSLSPGLRAVIPGEGGPYGDYRDWEAIRAWAAEVKAALLAWDLPAGEPLALRNVVLSFTDMPGVDLSQADLQGAELRQARLSRADLRAATLIRTDLAAADLREADLRGAALGWANLRACDLRRARLREANLMGADLRRARLKAADMRRAVLNGANLSHARLQRARLQRADLNWANLSHADLRRANLKRAGLGWANLTGARLDGANLRRARYNDETQWPEGFEAAAAGCILVPRPH